MEPDSFLRGAARVFAGPPLGMVAMTTVVLAIGLLGGLKGVPLLACGATWAWTYCFLIVTALAHGLPPPVFSIEHANPAHMPRPVLHLLLIALVAGLGWWLQVHYGDWAAIGLGAAVLTVLPASLALLAVEGNALRAVSPVAILRVSVGLGLRYPALLALGAGYALLLFGLAGALPTALTVALGVLLFYSLATALGTALFARRLELGLDAWQAPEIHAARAEREAERARAALAQEVYGLIRARHADQAWARATEWLAAADRDPAAYRFLHERALEWGETRFADRLGDELVARLVALGRRGEALEVVEACWRRGGRWAPGDYRDRDALESVANELGHVASRERLRAERSQNRPGG